MTDIEIACFRGHGSSASRTPSVSPKRSSISTRVRAAVTRSTRTRPFGFLTALSPLVCGPSTRDAGTESREVGESLFAAGDLAHVHALER